MTEWLSVSEMLFAIIVLCVLGAVVWRFVGKRKQIVLPELYESNLAHSFGRVLSTLGFEDALNAEQSSIVVKDRMLREVNEALGSTAKGLVVGLEIVEAVEARDLILAKFPEATAKMLEKGSAVQVATKNGEKLLIAVDKNGRKFISQAKQVDPSLVGKMSQATTLIIGAAHIIAGYDNARKLRTIDRKLDRLIHGMKSQRVSKLAEAYETLKFILVSEEDASKAKSDLRGLQRDLRELRNIWIDEIKYELKGIDNPNRRPRLSRLFSRNQTTANGLKDRVMEHESVVHYVRFALKLEHAICQVLGEGEVFNEVTIPEIRQQIGNLSALVEERQRWVGELVKGTTENEMVVLYEEFEKSLK